MSLFLSQVLNELKTKAIIVENAMDIRADDVAIDRNTAVQDIYLLPARSVILAKGLTKL
ncbi:MAG: hypothetical protein BROFUL_00399 [Candidatus Brocadia fulgida]|uniref:Uncharacterized protein n=1 Tax=Candidatus Brocadia fulgida TaxID=380242 RepID=A0A0M2V2E6_9BACT|nr:MAG: hypothetical protein BROFUL_00399 [Candidatus Brocadia fulgida]